MTDALYVAAWLVPVGIAMSLAMDLSQRAEQWVRERKNNKGKR